MDTTAGAWAFVGLEARNNGAIVQKLLDAGLIVLGKTNMTVSLRFRRLETLADDQTRNSVA